MPYVGGGTMYEQSPIRTAFQGQIAFLETTAGSCANFLKDVLRQTGTFDARIYEGSPQRHFKSKKVERCFINLDAPDRDWENKQQVLMLTGTIFGHYFGVEYPGNL